MSEGLSESVLTTMTVYNNNGQIIDDDEDEEEVNSCLHREKVRERGKKTWTVVFYFIHSVGFILTLKIYDIH